MPELRFYLDSSVWNCCFNEHVPDLQAQSRSLFDRILVDEKLRPYLSDVVLQELGDAPVQRRQLLATLLREIAPVRFDLDEESASLAEAYIRHGVLTVGHLVDARHVAIATVAEVDALVSWNYRHLVNRRRREAFNGVNAIMGYRSVEIISPPEVFDD
jgi:hypothetical protein